MNPISFDLERALGRARDQLAEAACATAAPGAGGEAAAAAQAGAARAAIFADAVLSAVRARLEELKTVSK
jgi:hypothetical protein